MVEKYLKLSFIHIILFLGCPTPPNRRRFFSSRGLKGSVWSFKGLTQSSSNNNTLSGVVLFEKFSIVLEFYTEKRYRKMKEKTQNH